VQKFPEELGKPHTGTRKFVRSVYEKFLKKLESPTLVLEMVRTLHLQKIPEAPHWY